MLQSNRRMNRCNRMWKNTFVKSSNCIRMWNSCVKINNSALNSNVFANNSCLTELLLRFQIHYWIQWDLRVYHICLFRLERTDHVKHHVSHPNCLGWVFCSQLFRRQSIKRKNWNYSLIFWLLSFCFASLESLIKATKTHWTLYGFYADLLKCFGVLHSSFSIVNSAKWWPINSMCLRMRCTSWTGTHFQWNWNKRIWHSSLMLSNRQIFAVLAICCAHAKFLRG